MTRLHAGFERKDTLAGRLEALEEAGVYGRVADRLATTHPLWRIEQAIQHQHVADKHLDTPLPAQWLMYCLDRNWIPLPLLARRSRPAQFTLEQRNHRALTSEGLDFIAQVRCAIRALDFWQWVFLVHEAITSTADEFYRRLFFENPSRSNWLLCEKVYGVSKRIDLPKPSIAQHLERVVRFTIDAET